MNDQSVVSHIHNLSIKGQSRFSSANSVFTSLNTRRFTKRNWVAFMIVNISELKKGNGEWAFCNKRSHGTKSAILEGKLIIIPALGH